MFYEGMEDVFMVSKEYLIDSIKKPNWFIFFRNILDHWNQFDTFIVLEGNENVTIYSIATY